MEETPASLKEETALGVLIIHQHASITIRGKSDTYRRDESGTSSLLHLLEKPALPRPNRTLGGTKDSDDMAPVRSAISVSAGLSFSCLFSTFFTAGDFGDSFDSSSGCEETFSPSMRLARRREFLMACELVDDRRR